MDRDNVEVYPMLRDVIKVMQKHLPHYFGNFTFSIDFRDGVPYKVKDVWGERSLDMEKLK